jgi:hypothetical protein
VRVETIPLILGVLVAIVGIGLIADAWLPERVFNRGERRRKARAERHLVGEAAIGIGMLCMAAALIGRDTWSYGTVAVIVGTLLFLAEYLKERITNRGALRRGAPKTTDEPKGKTRIR